MASVPTATSMKGICRWCQLASGFEILNTIYIESLTAEQVRVRLVNSAPRHLGEPPKKPTPETLALQVLECRHCKKKSFSVEDIIKGTQLHFWPILTASSSKDVPAAIQEAMQEAEITLQVGCLKSSATMSRRALEAVCDDNSCGKGALRDKIAKLRESNLLPKAVNDWLSDVRIIGNEGAHPKDSDVTREDCEVNLRILKKVVEHLYIETAEIERSRRINRST